MGLSSVTHQAITLILQVREELARTIELANKLTSEKNKIGINDQKALKSRAIARVNQMKAKQEETSKRNEFKRVPVQANINNGEDMMMNLSLIHI